MNTTIVSILLTILTACVGAGAAVPTDQPDKKPPKEVGEDQHFCCSKVDLADLTGEDCVAVGVESINTCAAVLYCEGSWGKEDAKVACE
jgi:hypothetical protein